MTQVGACLHDGVDLLDCVLGLGLGGHSVDLDFLLFVDQCIWATGLNHHDIAVEGGDIKERRI